MTEIVLDDVLKERLGGLAEPVRIRNKDGSVVALVTPINERLLECPYTEEEIERARNSDEWYTTEEVLEHLGKL